MSKVLATAGHVIGQIKLTGNGANTPDQQADGSVAARTATCRCGLLSAICKGEPVRVSVCHCYDCRKRSGSAFAVQARFPADAVTISGEHKVYVHAGGSGNTAEFHFCPVCGGTLWFHALPDRALYAIPVGAFADKDFPTPEYTVYVERKHGWVTISDDIIEYRD
jgi:hypothetical protein